MSWGFKFAAKDKDKAKNRIAEFATSSSGSFPLQIADLMTAQIDAMRDPTDGEVLLIESNGHVDSTPTSAGYFSNNGMAQFSATIVSLLASLLLFAMPVRAQEPKFGGCLKNGTTCFGPTVSVNVVAIALRDGTPTSTFDPGIGYGAMFYATSWYKLGVSGSIAFPTLDAGRRVQPSLLFSFAEYARIGLACPLWKRGGFPENGQLLLSFGTDFGFAR